jgi:GH24 family phage-related lysozyme (muramidase)
MRETGVGIQDPLFFIGVVENNVDQRLEKRVQVRAFGVHGTVDQVPTENLPWATLICGGYDPNTPLPPVNSFVFGFFVDGRDAQQPMILGLIPTQMTEVIDPAVTGWGALPGRDSNILARGSTPEDYGQPANSRLERGEDLDQTYVLLQEMNRVRDVPTARTDSNDETPPFEEPAPAYNAQYPFNRVIETASHSIELDDTPGAERITVFHKSGSFVQIDSRGTTVHKSVSDKYEINDTHQHVYVGGKSQVTIIGDSRVLVKGNKIEEVEGDLIQVVHGNHLLSVAGQMNLNGSEEVQMRAAKLRLESNVESINIKSARDIKIQSGENTHIKSKAMFIDSELSAYIKSGADIRIEATGKISEKSETMYLTATGALDIKGGHVKAGGGTKVSINASIVAIDDLILLADGQAIAPDPATTALSAQVAEATELPEPAAKSASTTQYRNSSSIGSSGYTSQDEGGSSSVNIPGADPAADFTGSANASMDLLTLIKSFEGFSQYPYEDYGQWSVGYGSFSGPSSQPPRIPGPISEEEATNLLGQEVQRFIINVETVNQLGNYNWSQESKDALTSFAYNIGSINELTANGTRDNQTIANKMLEYVNAGGVPLSGLVERRRIEREKFLNGLAGTLPQTVLV